MTARGRTRVSGGVRRESYVANGSDIAAVFRPTGTVRRKVGPLTLDWDVTLDSNVEELRWRAGSEARWRDGWGACG